MLRDSSLKKLCSFLKHIFIKKHLFVGIGSYLRSDDQAGLLICDKLVETGIDCLKCESGLEMCLSDIGLRKPEALIILDAVFYPGCSPGEILVADEDVIREQVAPVTTHSIPLGMIMKLLKSMNYVKEIYIIGICPRRVDIGLDLSGEVSHSIDKLVGIISSCRDT